MFIIISCRIEGLFDFLLILILELFGNGIGGFGFIERLWDSRINEFIGERFLRYLLFGYSFVIYV